VRVPLAGATWATARVVAERDGLTASRETGLLLAPAPEARAPAPPAPIEAPPSVEIVAQRDEAPITPAPVEEPVGEVVLNQVSLPRRGTPAPALGPILALAIGAALSAAPRRRAR